MEVGVKEKNAKYIKENKRLKMMKMREREMELEVGEEADKDSEVKPLTFHVVPTRVVFGKSQL
jgi:hypothetical protein